MACEARSGSVKCAASVIWAPMVEQTNVHPGVVSKRPFKGRKFLCVRHKVVFYGHLGETVLRAQMD